MILKNTLYFIWKVSKNTQNLFSTLIHLHIVKIRSDLNLEMPYNTNNQSKIFVLISLYYISKFLSVLIHSFYCLYF